MESASSVTFFGALANGLSILIKEHGPSRLVFTRIKSQLQHFQCLINEKAPDEVKIIQTGSSFDDLHMCVYNVENLQGKQFYPDTDFDICMLYKTFPIEDCTGYDVATDDNEFLSERLKTSKAAALMMPSQHEGYVTLLITENGKAFVAQPRCKIGKFIDQQGYVTNNVFNDEWLQDKTDDVELLYKRCGSDQHASSKSNEFPYRDTSSNYLEPSSKKFTVSGPALTDLGPAKHGFTYDFVQGFPCEKWPVVADRWSKRPRDAKWPHKELIQDVINDGCLVVPVGYYTSTEQRQEWRLSFNMAERRLSLALSQNQRTCYCLVKLLLKSELSEASVLTSYMVKNMMFWFCEQMFGEDEWSDDCLGERIMQLIDYICLALENHNIPHYFLPRNNLIRHKRIKDVQETLMEIRAIKAKPMETMVKVCTKIQCFEIQIQLQSTTMNETRYALLLYTVITQSLYRKGMLEVLSKPVATRCFTGIITLNVTSQFMSLKRSNLFAALSVPELLRSTAMLNMQAGKVDEAISLFQIMLDCDRQVVRKTYPETLSNLGCLYAVKMDSANSEDVKKKFGVQADEFFKEALTHTHNSPSLHLAYGNFLKDNNMGLLKATDQFKLAISLTDTRDDDDALIQIAVPGKTTHEQVPGKVVAYYLLVSVLAQIDDIYEARRYAAKFEDFTSTLPLNHKRCGYQFCILAYKTVGLTVKAHIVQKELKENKIAE